MSAEIKCPACGAPPPAGFTVPQGQFGYRCIYCNQTSTLGTPAPTPSAPMTTGPINIYVHHYGNEHDDDGDDYDYHPQHHFVPPVIHTAHRTSWMVWLIVVVIVSLGGSGGLLFRCTHHNAILSSMVWSGQEPLVCSGNENINVSGVTVSFNAGTAIVANGNCHVKCTDCNITAGTAIEAGGNADVTIINGTIKGTTLLADASGNAHVTIMGNVVATGPTKHGGNAKVSAPPSAASAPVAAAKPPTPATPVAPSVAPTAKKKK